MTQEEKAKAYDKAIEKMKSKLKDFKEIIINRSDIEEIFPNLQESEDERIRKGMLQGFKDYEEPEYEWWKGVKVKECIAWLEKQGQSKKVSIWKHWKDGIAGNGDGIPVFLIKNGFTYSLSSCLGFECDYIELSELDNLMLEQQGNPTEINPSEFDLRLNKLLEQFKTLPKEELESSLGFYLDVIQNDGTYKDEKPKFEAGNWITNGEFVWLISNVDAFDYEVISPEGKCVTDTISHVDEYFHLWSIEEAKDGDVLVALPPKGSEHSEQIFIFKEIKDRDYVKNAIDYHCRLFDGKLGIDETGFMGTTNDEFVPATKEQRNLLFSKMKEAGWSWNAEVEGLSQSKEINKGWSEEVCNKISSIKYLLHELDNYNFDNWLDSLKYNKPSWSEEDSEAIGQAIIALESFNNIDKSDNHFAGYSLSLEDAIKRLKSFKQRMKG